MYSFYGWVILHCVYVPQLQTPHLKETSDKVALCSTNLIPRCGHREEKTMTAISAINDHYVLKVFATILCVHRVGQNLFSRHASLQGKFWRRGKSGYLGASGGTRGVNLLFAVPCPCFFLRLDLGFHIYSPDVDECANPRSCPEHSTCHNSLGNYSCVCNSGYISRSGKKSFQGAGETCQGKCRGFWGIKSNLFGKTAVLDEELKVEVAQLSSQSCLQNWSQFIHSCIHSTNTCWAPTVCQALF